MTDDNRLYIIVMKFRSTGNISRGMLAHPKPAVEHIKDVLVQKLGDKYEFWIEAYQFEPVTVGAQP